MNLAEAAVAWSRDLVVFVMSKGFQEEDAREIAQDVWVNLARHTPRELTRQIVFGRVGQRIADRLRSKRSARALSDALHATGGEFWGSTPCCRYCDRPRFFGNLCNAHFMRQQRGAPMDAPIRSYRRKPTTNQQEAA